MKETKNGSGSIICEENDRILLSESNLSSGFPVSALDLGPVYTESDPNGSVPKV